MPIWASRETLAEVAAQLCPVTGKTSRQINAALPFTGRPTIYNALFILVRDGLATFEGEMNKRRYRRVEARP